MSPNAPCHAAPRTPATPTDRTLYHEHYARLVEYTDALREGRCRRTNHFDARLKETVSVFVPLFAAWNMEILFALYMRDALHFNELKRLLAPLSSRVLSDKLSHLTRRHLVQRIPSDRRVTYRLSVKGQIVARHLHPLVFFLHNAE